MEGITSEEIELFHSMHEMLAHLNDRIKNIERDLLNIRAANSSQVVVIDRAISNLGKIIGDMRFLK
jgi:hypothetical protein